MKKFSTLIVSLGLVVGMAATAQAGKCPNLSTTQVRNTDVVTVELPASGKPAAMGTRAALLAQGFSILAEGATIYDRVDSKRKYCDGSQWVSMEPGEDGTSGSGGGGGYLSCSTPQSVQWSTAGSVFYGGCKGSAGSGGSKNHGTSVKVTDPTDGGADCGYRAHGSATFKCQDGSWVLDKSKSYSCTAQTNCK